MRNSTRFVIAAAAAGTVVAALAGCTASPAEGSGSPSPTQAATTTTAAPTTAPTTTSAPAPTTAPAAPAAPTAPTERPTATPTRSALAQHIFDECNKGAADAGVVLEFTAEPSGYAAADDYQLVYPIARFVDGHTDEWAIYTCTLTDDTVHSTFVRGGVTDTH
ncbi:hypothetical protein [Curtobacterium aurantiacum]|uniref:hypothetical protein n=1 Tax=Curtobacterium aurantiacum TaxID=3236919 RepID=UPI001BDE37EF|nr:hypothetical protein [Curtobacterium flaccumfaciens]MBT1680053.1 hypothetical protein [Curtobacterium flaccumfaciens pv. flaccumfaciens]